MVWSRVAVIVVCVGCYAPVPPTGAPCSPSGACPRGQQCDPTGICVLEIAIDAATIPGDDGAPSDSPDAGLVTCPPGSHDEDGDGLGDACDPCPHIAGNANDTDGDGVGDACDPHPGEADRIVLFESFATTPVGWQLPGAWVITNDRLVASSSMGSTSATRSGSGRDAVITTHVTFSPTNNGTDPNAAVLAAATSSTTFYKCAVHAAPRVELVRHGTGVLTLAESPLMSAAWLESRLTSTVEVDRASCAVRRGALTETVTSDDTVLAGTGMGLRVREGTAMFDYVIVIARQ